MHEVLQAEPFDIRIKEQLQNKPNMPLECAFPYVFATNLLH